MPANPLTSNNFIDSCAFDPKYEPEDGASNEIFGLYNAGQLLIQIAHSTQKETKHPNTPDWVKAEAMKLIYTIPVQLTEGEVRKLREIELILAGNGKVENIRQDAMHIFESQKYGSYFVTTDARILNRAGELRTICGVTILKPSVFLSIVKHYIGRKSHQEIFGALTEPPMGRNSQEKTKMTSVSYKGYLIQAAPYQLADSGEFTINIDILRDSGGTINIRNFSTANTFKTEGEAIQQCFEFGRLIIDGKVKNCTITDL